MMKKIFILLIITIFVSVSKVQAQLEISYFVQGDADDWQLFMSKKLTADMAGTSSGGKTVMITLTAGDEGNGANAFNGSPIAYYLAKERGAIYASKTASEFTVQPLFPKTYPIPVAQNVVINGKTLVKYYYGNPNGQGSITNYFLRLPDGGATGTGYIGTGLQSLKRLQEGTISTMTSVDGVNSYTWTELVNTIYAIIFAEKSTDPQIWLHTASLNLTTNPNDHSDHFYSATAAQEAVATRLWIGIIEFVMNHSSNLPDNLNFEEYEVSSHCFGLYDWSLVKDLYPSKLSSTVRAWFPKEYSTIKRSPVGNGPLPITLLNFTGTLKGNDVLLDWSTSNELNSKEFEIEKSNDGITYRSLNSIPAAGFSTSTKNYGYLDIEATEINYYRLKMVDLDGKYRMSDVVIIKNNGLAQDLTSVTNPFKNYINIRFAKIPKGKVSYRLIDLTGKLMSRGESYNPLTSVIRFDLYSKSLSKGIYILQVESEGKQYSYKLLTTQQ